jgi:ferric-dicitrate binding protein FerR (iron transport regulator)
MNRYNAVPLEIANPQATELRVSGAFRAGDSLSFAQAVAKTYRLELSNEHDRIVLNGTPRAAY